MKIHRLASYSIGAFILLTSCDQQTPRNDQNRHNSSSSNTGYKLEVPKNVKQTKKPEIALYGTTTPTSEFTTCMETGDAAQGVTVGIMDCLGSEIDRQDERLNVTYKAVMAGADLSKSVKVRQLQRLWIKKRDRKCSELAADSDGGSLGGIIYSQCILDQTIERSRWLELKLTT